MLIINILRLFYIDINYYINIINYFHIQINKRMTDINTLTKQFENL